jgi:hypothetical protein
MYDRGEGDYEFFLECGCRVIGIPLGEMLSSKEFELREARWIDDKTRTRKLIRIAFGYSGPKARWRRPGGIYWAELDPQSGFLISRGGVIVPTTQREEKQQLEYQWVDDVPFPSMLTYIYANHISKTTEKQTYRYTRPTVVGRANAEFYLPHYDIPESVLGMEGPRVSTRFVLFVLAGVGIILAIGLRLVARRWSVRSQRPQVSIPRPGVTGR